VPTAIALANLGFQVVLNLILYRFGIWSIPLATSFVNLAGTLALLLVLRRRMGRIDTRRTLTTYAKATIGALVAAGVAYGVWWALDDELGRSVWMQIVSLGSALLVATGVYLGVARILRMGELDTLLSLVRRPRTA
jgi:putative peptidoglycan lipid II flippase